MNAKILSKAIEIIRLRRMFSLEKRETALNKAKQSPDYLELLNTKKMLTLNLSHTLAQNDDPKLILEKIDNLDKEILNYENSKNIKQEYFVCDLCKDVGYGKDGKMCHCLLKVYNQLIREESGMKTMPNFKFGNNHIDKFNCSQKENIAHLYKLMKDYCDKFPNNKFKKIIFSGNVGVGKSCLVSAVANELLDKNINVQIISAFTLNSILLKYHTTDISLRLGYMDNLTECDMLIIDDLGTEPILKNVTLEYLDWILEARMFKHTIITTNLTKKELLERYKERIFSRLAGTVDSSIITIDGDDLRLKK